MPGKVAKGFAALTPEERHKMAVKGGSSKAKKPRGFAAIDKEEHRKLSAKGGKATWAKIKEKKNEN